MSIVAKRLYGYLCDLFLRKNVRYFDKGRLFLNNDALLLNTRHLLISIHDKASEFVPALGPKWSQGETRTVPLWDFLLSIHILPAFSKIYAQLSKSCISLPSQGLRNCFFAFFDKKFCRFKKNDYLCP